MRCCGIFLGVCVTPSTLYLDAAARVQRIDVALLFPFKDNGKRVIPPKHVVFFHKNEKLSPGALSVRSVQALVVYLFLTLEDF